MTRVLGLPNEVNAHPMRARLAWPRRRMLFPGQRIALPGGGRGEVLPREDGNTRDPFGCYTIATTDVVGPLVQFWYEEELRDA